MRDPLPVVCGLEDTLTWAQKKAVLLLVGGSVAPVQDLAVALGVHPDQVEAIYQETRAKRRQAHEEAIAAGQAATVIPLIA